MIDKSRIYIGYNKSNKRCLLYELDDNNYKDLENNLIYTRDKIYLSSLVQYSQLIEISRKKSLFAKPFVNEFQQKESEIINLKRVCIAPIYVITEVSDERMNGAEYSALCRRKLIKRRTLLFHEDWSYINLFNNQEYNGDFFFTIGDFLVEPKYVKPFTAEMGICETHLPKRKILQLYVDKYGVE